MLRHKFDRGFVFARFLLKRLRDDSCFEIAGALSYTTVFALVPLTAVAFGIFAVFSMSSEWSTGLTNFIFENFVPSAARSVQGYLTEFATNANRTTVFGVSLLFLSALMLMASIEDAYNRIWRISEPRHRMARFLMYSAALTLGPLLGVIVLGLSSYVFALPLINHAEEQYGLRTHVLQLLPAMITWFALSLSYALIPNQKQSWRSAALGGLLAAGLFEISKWGFAMYLTSMASYQEVYGALAAVPIFLGWVYLSWLVVLLGASFASALEAFDYQALRAIPFKNTEAL